MPRSKRSSPINKRMKAYLTKRALLRATGKATRSVSSRAMNLEGYVIQAENGWVVRIDNTGRRENISRIARVKTNQEVALD
jgi:hypothetical protein